MKWALILLTFGSIHGYANGGSTSAISILFQSEKLCQDALSKVIDTKVIEKGYSSNDVKGYCVKTSE